MFCYISKRNLKITLDTDFNFEDHILNMFSPNAAPAISLILKGFIYLPTKSANSLVTVYYYYYYYYITMRTEFCFLLARQLGERFG